MSSISIIPVYGTDNAIIDRPEDMSYNDFVGFAVESAVDFEKSHFGGIHCIDVDVRDEDIARALEAAGYRVDIA